MATRLTPALARTPPAGHARAALTYGAQLAWGEAVLTEASSPTPQLDALVLLMWTLRVPHAAILDQLERTLPAELAACYAAWVGRRVAGEPVAYITGHKTFMGLDLLADSRVLLVRPSTQVLVEIALEIVRLQPEAELRAADVGTGSGAVALALAVHEPRFVRLYAVDCSADALAVARQNGARYGMDDRIAWLCGDVLAPVPEPVDLIIANLPYLPTAPGMGPVVAATVLCYEPHVAFFGGEDGLDLIRRLIAQAPAKLRPAGVLAMEVRLDACEAVAALLRHALPGARVYRGREPGRTDHVLVAQLLVRGASS